MFHIRTFGWSKEMSNNRNFGQSKIMVHNHVTKITVHSHYLGQSKITFHSHSFGRSKLRPTTVILDCPIGCWFKFTDIWEISPRAENDPIKLEFFVSRQIFFLSHFIVEISQNFLYNMINTPGTVHNFCPGRSLVELGENGL